MNVKGEGVAQMSIHLPSKCAQRVEGDNFSPVCVFSIQSYLTNFDLLGSFLPLPTLKFSTPTIRTDKSQVAINFLTGKHIPNI